MITFDIRKSRYWLRKWEACRICIMQRIECMYKEVEDIKCPQFSKITLKRIICLNILALFAYSMFNFTCTILCLVTLSLFTYTMFNCTCSIYIFYVWLYLLYLRILCLTILALFTYTMFNYTCTISTCYV